MIYEVYARYGPIRDGYLGPYQEVNTPIGEPQDGWQLWETRREPIARYEEAVLEPKEEVFGE